MGLAFAECFGNAGMNVVMADVEEKALRVAASRVEAAGASVLPVVTDVSDEASMDHLGEAVQEAFGTPADEITHSVDVRGVVERKLAAIAAHASQIPPDSFFLSMPIERFTSAFGAEWFVDPDAPRKGEPFRTGLLLD